MSPAHLRPLLFSECRPVKVLSCRIYHISRVFVGTIMYTIIVFPQIAATSRHIYFFLSSVSYVVSIGSKPSASIFAIAASSA